MAKGKSILIKYTPLIILFLIVISAQIIIGYEIFGWFDTWQDRGTFGDMFGAVNTLFSGLAFAGIIFAISLQSKELELQRSELELTREELKGQKEQLQNQNTTLQIQNAENTFFQMVSLHNDIINGIDIRGQSADASATKTGRDCFKDFHNTYMREYRKINKQSSDSHSLKIIDKSYNQFLSIHQSDTGHYFRNLFNIIKYVDNSILPDKKMYSNLVRAQLSSYELALLFYNCLSQVGNEKFKPLVEKYALLKNIYFGHLLEATHKTLYDPKAYQSSNENTNVS